MVARRASATRATSVLRGAGAEFTEHTYDYVPHGGTAEAARQLHVDEHEVVKTLIMVDDRGRGHVVLMHGDRRVSLKELARQIGVKHVVPAPQEEAPRWSGYQVGGTSPFGTRKAMPVWVEATVLGLERIYLNGGQRGYLVGIAPGELVRILGATPVNVTAT